MDEFLRGTLKYDQAHGLYRTDRGRLVVVSPGQGVPRRAKRVGSLAHPGVMRDHLRTLGNRATAEVLLAAQHIVTAATGAGQGCDISEFQATTPGGYAFYVNRYLNEYDRTDSRAAQHYADVRAMGALTGSYGIIKPGAADPYAWANHYVQLLRQWPTDFEPVIDVELGDANACQDFCIKANSVLRGAGYSALMGYYSAGSAYRRTCQDLYEDDWLAAWGGAYPAGAAMHQWQGSPRDLDYCPNFAVISGGTVTPPPPPVVRKVYGQQQAVTAD